MLLGSSESVLDIYALSMQQLLAVKNEPYFYNLH